jgi:hypothetical protein
MTRTPKHHRRSRPKKRSFDCIAFKRRAQARIRRKLHGMTSEQELAYWNRPPDGPLAGWWRSIQEHSTASRG